MRASVRLSLPRDAGWVPLVRSMAGGLLRQAGTPDDAAADLQLALTEACANVVRHAVSTDSYSVTLSVEADGCEVEVADRGPGFTIAGADEPAGEEAASAEAEAETGRGLGLMQALVDELELRSDAEATRLVLRKRWAADSDADPEPATGDDRERGDLKRRVQHARPLHPEVAAPAGRAGTVRPAGRCRGPATPAP